MATDSAGNVHLLAVGRMTPQQTSLSVLHLVWDGVSWSVPRTLMTPDIGVVEWPRIVVGLGNQLHAVWFTRDKGFEIQTEDNKFKVWYSRALAPAPALSPSPYSTPVPTPLPAATPTAALVLPTPQPVDAALPQVGIGMDSMRSEMDEVGLILLSGVPVIVLALIAALWIRHR
jgi:hypothetical protein